MYSLTSSKLGLDVDMKCLLGITVKWNGPAKVQFDWSMSRMDRCPIVQQNPWLLLTRKTTLVARQKKESFCKHGFQEVEEIHFGIQTQYDLFLKD